MKPDPQADGGGDRGEATAGARGPGGGAGGEFAAAFGLLREAVRRACADEPDWQRTVGAAVRAALSFAAANPRRTRTLTIDADPGDRDEMTAYFAARLAAAAPAASRLPVSTDRAVIESILLVVRSHIATGDGARLPELAADLTFLALLPYTGGAGPLNGNRVANDA